VQMYIEICQKNYLKLGNNYGIGFGVWVRIRVRYRVSVSGYRYTWHNSADVHRNLSKTAEK